MRASKLNRTVWGTKERGSIMIMVGLMAVILIAFVGLAIDVGRMYAAKAELSRAADAAALAGIVELDGTAAGKAAAKTKALNFGLENEPTASWQVTPDPNTNKLTVNATKNVKMYFLSLVGIDNADVKGHAAAGFDLSPIDAVMVIDATASMVGNPITNAKAAASDFKDVLLGTNPTGNVVVGVTPFRGCYRPSPLAASNTACIDTNTEVQALSFNPATLNSKINAITAGGGNAGTNVCTGLAEGWSILTGAGNHMGDTNARTYMVLLSDGDNYYAGNYTYQAPTGTAPPSSPNGIAVAGVNYPCQPYDYCSVTWTVGTNGSPCSTGTSASKANGYMNGNDGSNPATCNENPRPRERQLDVRTLELAEAMKAQGVEVFVVAFTAAGIPGCNLGDATVYNDGDPACNTVLDSPAGPVGSSNTDNNANHRLLKCIASSSGGTNDHYYFANAATDLPAIFTKIAQKIAHRLTE